MSRSGERVITTDQTLQLIHNENIKADMRNESDRALMLILTAVMGHKKKGEEKALTDEEQAQEREETQAAMKRLVDEHDAKNGRGPSNYSSSSSSSAGGGESTDSASGERGAEETKSSSSNGGVGVGGAIRAVPSAGKRRVLGAGKATAAMPTIGEGNEGTTAEGIASDPSLNGGDSVVSVLSNTCAGVAGESQSHLADPSMMAASTAESVTSGSPRASTAQSQSKKPAAAAPRRRKGKSMLGKNAWKAGVTDDESSVASAASAVGAAHDDGGVGAALAGIATGVDLDIKATLHKSMNYQVGSQAFPLAGLASSKGGGDNAQSRFLRDESEMSAEVIKCIEAREQELFKLQVEAQNVHAQYLNASEGRLSNMDVDGVIGELMMQMRKLRESTIKVCESYGAWARLLHKEKTKKKGGLANKSAASDPRASRTYCVNIAMRGPMVYPQSRAMKSTVSGKFGRSSEKAKYSTDVKYVGEFTNRDDAQAAFSAAMSRIEPNKLLPADTDGFKSLVGLRKCGKHYLVRSGSVPQDIPCEACGAAKLARPSRLVGAPFEEDETEELHQFIWRGTNYLLKMWTDTDFLQQSVLLPIVLPDFRTFFNPLLLPSQDYYRMLKVLRENPQGKALKHLVGRLEQVRQAQSLGNFVPRTHTGYELKALPFSADWTGDPSGTRLKVEAEKSFDRMKLAYITGNLDDPAQIRSMQLAIANGGPGGGNSAVDKVEATRQKDENTGFTPWSTLTPAAALNDGSGGASILGRSLPSLPESDNDQDEDEKNGTNDSKVFAATAPVAPQGETVRNEQGIVIAGKALFDRGVTVDSVLYEDPLDYVSKARLQRAFFVLGQSTTLNKKQLPQEVLPADLKKSILDSNGLQRANAGHGTTAESPSPFDSVDDAGNFVVAYGSSPLDGGSSMASMGSTTSSLRNGALRDSRQGIVIEQGDDKYVFCSIVLCSLLVRDVSVSVSLSLSIAPCLHSLTPWHESNHHPLPLNRSSIDTILTLLPQVQDTRHRGALLLPRRLVRYATDASAVEGSHRGRVDQLQIRRVEGNVQRSKHQKF
jgi:hypothetical protein